MINPLHAKHYADRALSRTVSIVENIPIARDTYRLRFDCSELAERALPGQFFMVRLSRLNDPLLGRALALYDTVLTPQGAPIGIDVVYLVLGKMTSLLSNCRPGDEIDVWGPLGNGFVPCDSEQIVMVAGGIGYTPFPAVAREYLGGRRYGTPLRTAGKASRVILCYGARTADLLAGIEKFREIGVELRIATDDGTLGHHGRVTEVLEQVLDEAVTPPHVICCGPEPMMEATAKITASRGIFCEVSLETPMACGIGICFSCVTKVSDASGQWDYKRTCVDGPVFNAKTLVW